MVNSIALNGEGNNLFASRENVYIIKSTSKFYLLEGFLLYVMDNLVG